MKKTTLLLVLLSMLVLPTACSPAGSAPTQITVQLSWFHTVEFAGFYVAAAKGYYADENLEVKLVPGGFDILPWNEVAEGRADIGIAGGDSLLIARSNGLPLKAVATIFRKSPVVLMSLASSGIKNPKDLVGKRVGLTSTNMDNTNDIQLLAMLHQVKIDQAQLELVPIQDFSVGSLTSGAMDVYSGFLQNEPVDAQLKGVDTNLIFPQDYGVMIYANVLFAREQFLSEKPDVVTRFLRATYKGYQYAIEHPDEAAVLAVQYDNALDTAFQTASMKAEVPLIDTGDAPIGSMDQAVWQSTNDILAAQGLIPAPLELNQVYTNDFVTQPR